MAMTILEANDKIQEATILVKIIWGTKGINRLKFTFVNCIKITSHKTIVGCLISYYNRPPPPYQC